jgi:hypothetical protein
MTPANPTGLVPNGPRQAHTQIQARSIGVFASAAEGEEPSPRSWTLSGSSRWKGLGTLCGPSGIIGGHVQQWDDRVLGESLTGVQGR